MRFAIKKDFILKNDEEVTIFIEVCHFTGSRPAPACSNPDSPAFSDCGDDCDYDAEYYLIEEDGGEKELHYSDPVLNELEDRLHQLICKKGEEESREIIFERELSHYENCGN